MDTIQLNLKSFFSLLLHQSSNDMSLVLLNCADEFTCRTDTAKNFATHQHYIPLPALFKHTLTSSKLLTNDFVYSSLSNSCAKVVLKMQQSLRSHTVILQKRVRSKIAIPIQIYTSQPHHHTDACHSYKTTKKKFITLNFTDSYLSKLVLLKYIKMDATAIPEYLHCNINCLTNLLQYHTNSIQDQFDIFPFKIPTDIYNDEDPIFLPPNNATTTNHNPTQNDDTHTTNTSNTLQTPPPDNTFDYDSSPEKSTNPNNHIPPNNQPNTTNNSNANPNSTSNSNTNPITQNNITITLTTNN